MIFVDTNIWSIALRRDHGSEHPAVKRLITALNAGEQILTTGVVLQELLQGFNGPNAKKKILADFASLPLINPQRVDHIDAADLRNTCRRSGVQIGTIDALITQLCIRHSLLLLTDDQDFTRIKKYAPLRVWQP